jgi:hypothetical protein
VSRNIANVVLKERRDGAALLRHTERTARIFVERDVIDGNVEACLGEGADNAAAYAAAPACHQRDLPLCQFSNSTDPRRYSA